MKTSDMEVGAIGFHDRTKVKRLKVEKNNEIVKVINKTKTERFPDLEAQQMERAADFQREQKDIKRKQFQQQKELEKQREHDQRQRSYADVMIEDNMRSNKDVPSSVDVSAAKQFEEDFM